MRKTIPERIDDRVDASGGQEACHPWTGNVGQWGNPTISITRPGGVKGGCSPRRVLWELDEAWARETE
jgi:hypothetical protein